jgi:hypothetical protein
MHNFFLKLRVSLCITTVGHTPQPERVQTSSLQEL